MSWYVFAFLSGLGLALRNIFYKVGSEKMDAAFAAMVLSLSMSAVAVGYYMLLRFYDQHAYFASMNTKGMIYSVIAGISLAAANIFLSYSYKAGGLASIVGIIQTCAAIALTVLIGVTLLNENIRPPQVAGIIAATVGVFMIIRG